MVKMLFKSLPNLAIFIIFLVLFDIRKKLCKTTHSLKVICSNVFLQTIYDLHLDYIETHRGFISIDSYHS